MLQRKPNNRLGINGITELREHIWFKNYPWEDLYNKKLISPFIPKNGDNFDKKYCEGADKIGNDTYERYQCYYKNDNFEDIFRNYTFYNIEPKEQDSPRKTPRKNESNTSQSGQTINYSLLGKTKIKVVNSISLGKGISMKDLISDNMTDRPSKVKVKNNSIIGSQFNHYNVQKSNHNRYQSMIPNNASYKFATGKFSENLPFIENKLTKSSSQVKLVNTGSSNKLTNSSSTNSIIKNQKGKFSTISSRSTGLSGPTNILHKRSGSTNFFKY